MTTAKLVPEHYSLWIDPLILFRVITSNSSKEPRIMPNTPNKIGRTIIAPNAIAVPKLRPIVRRSMVKPPMA